jgi:2-oxoglutarate ferredoxin oxidoreductase subunit alpha
MMADLKPKGSQYMLLSGNESIALGAIVAGCRFAASYPITPATPIFETLTRLFPLVEGRALQMEDEIAAVSAAIGASFAGEKALVSTSGPGLQLMTEQLNLASMIEVPLVVVDVQRGGPSTGLPTKTEQSDLNLAIYGVSGESPRIVLAPTSVEDSFYQMIRAFNLAERYQLPVIMLTDQSIGLRKATVQMPDLTHIIQLDSHVARTKVKIPQPEFINLIDRAEPTEKDLEDYRRFRTTVDGVSPIARPGTPGGQYLATGLEHTESGHPDYSPEIHLQMSRKRFRKMEVIARSFDANPIEIWGRPDAKIGILGWGSTAGAIREARYLAEERGIHVRQMHPHTLSPMPYRQISNFLVRLEHLIIVEENYTGQFAHHIKAHFGAKAIEIHKCEGIPITPEEILKGIEKVAGIIDEYSIARI